MSLVGNLEDLGLGDILQIVSLSRKSGVLSLQSRGREGKIVFQNGQVIRAASSVYRENVGDLLLRRGLVDVETLRQALAVQKQSPGRPRLGLILAERFGLAAENIEAIVKEQTEKIVYSLFGWADGTFSFALGEPEELAATSFNPLQFMLEQGLNPQWLAMEGSRLLDERLHRGEPLEELPQDAGHETARLLEAYESMPAAPVDRLPPVSSLLLVDAEEGVRTELGRVVSERGLAVSTFASSPDFVAAVEAAVAAKQLPTLLIDLHLPSPGGRGFFGGLTLLEEVRARFPRLPVMLLSNHSSDEAEQRARQLGVAAVVAKPKAVDPQGDIRLQATGEALLSLLAASVGPAGDAPPLYNIGAELMREFGEPEGTLRSGRAPSRQDCICFVGCCRSSTTRRLAAVSFCWFCDLPAK
jgi:CheY-like chemotaxis protein